MNTHKEYSLVKEQVRTILKEDERARNDDKWLTFRVMQLYTKIYIPFEDFKNIPAFETIRRTRAYIQNKEKIYTPTDIKVIERRKKREKIVRELVK